MGDGVGTTFVEGRTEKAPAEDHHVVTVALGSAGIEEGSPHPEGEGEAKVEATTWLVLPEAEIEENPRAVHTPEGEAKVLPEAEIEENPRPLGHGPVPKSGPANQNLFDFDDLEEAEQLSRK